MKSKLVILSLAIAVATSLVAAYCVADDALERREHHGESKADGHKRKGKHDQGDSTPAAASGAYPAACGGCHWAYLPQLLPQQSWKNLLASLGDHFGSEVALSVQQKAEVSDHLLSNAADRSAAKIGRKVLRSLGGTTPLRIVDVPYIQRKHRKLDTAVFSRKSVSSLSNCIACHPGAAGADFDDDAVRIPAN